MMQDKMRTGYRYGWVVVLAMVMLMSIVALPSPVAATVSDDINIDHVSFDKIHDGFASETITYRSDGITRYVPSGTEVTGITIAINDTGATSADNMKSRCFATMTVTGADSTTVYSVTSNTTTATPMYVTNRWMWFCYWANVSNFHFYPLFAVEQDLTIVTKLYSVSGGVATIDEVRTSYIHMSASYGEDGYYDAIVSASYYQGDDYDSLQDGSTVNVDINEPAAYLNIDAIHGNYSSSTRVDSYIVVTIYDGDGEIVYTRTSQEKSSHQLLLISGDNQWCYVTYDSVSCGPSMFYGGNYTLIIQLFTQANDYTGFVINDQWTVHLVVPVDTGDMGLAVLMNQTLGPAGLLFFIMGPVFGIFIARRADPMQGIIIALITMMLGGILVYVFMLGGA